MIPRLWYGRDTDRIEWNKNSTEEPMKDCCKAEIRKVLEEVTHYSPYYSDMIGHAKHLLKWEYYPKKKYCEDMQEAIDNGAYEKHGNQFYAVMRYKCGNPHKILTEKCIYCPPGENCIGGKG
jgi:hypothetical protein